MLEVGCGIDRNLGFPGNPSNIVIDVNESAINHVAARSHTALSVMEFDVPTNYVCSFLRLITCCFHMCEKLFVYLESMMVAK